MPRHPPHALSSLTKHSHTSPKLPNDYLLTQNNPRRLDQSDPYANQLFSQRTPQPNAQTPNCRALAPTEKFYTQCFQLSKNACCRQTIRCCLPNLLVARGGLLPASPAVTDGPVELPPRGARIPKSKSQGDFTSTAIDRLFRRRIYLLRPYLAIRFDF